MKVRDDAISDIRDAVAVLVHEHGNIARAATAVGLPVDAVRRVATGKGLTGRNVSVFREALGLSRLRIEPASETDTATPPLAVFERLRGRADEISALLAFALDRQRLLADDLAAMQRSALVQTVATQLASKRVRPLP